MDNFFSTKHFYLIRIQFLGFRYHGWQKQSNIKTVQGMVDKTIAYVLQHKNFKTLGCSRTDAMVSANDFAFELFCYEKMSTNFLDLLNQNLPSDIKALSINEIDESFNIIQGAKEKEYHYVFGSGGKAHPFGAPFLTYVQDALDTDLMKSTALEFVGEHNFKSFCVHTGEQSQVIRTVTECNIIKNDHYKGSFLPDQSFILIVKGPGFGRHQVRMMMAFLFDVGRGRLNSSDLKKSLSTGVANFSISPAPASGLILHKVAFTN